MTSQLNVDTIVDKAGSGGTNVKMGNTSTYVGEGGSGTQNTVQGLAKAWALSASGASPALDSFNISTVTDNSTGNYDFTISSAMGSNNFVVAGMATGLNKVLGTNRPSNTTTNIHVEVRNQAETLVDNDAQPSIHGDLA